MGIVLDEYEWAERAIRNHDLGKKPRETLIRVAKYYLANKYSIKETRNKLDAFLMQCDPNVSLVQWSATLDRSVRQARKYPLISIESVDITVKELQRIEELCGAQTRRLAFTLLCVSKYWDKVCDKNHHWVNASDRDIMLMANINTSVKRQSMMFAALRDAGMIRFSKRVDSLNVQVTFGDNSGEISLNIRDFRNLGYQYLRYYGGSYFECANCGITTKIRNPSKGRRPKYCSSCAIELHTKQRVDSVMRRRTASKSIQVVDKNRVAETIVPQRVQGCVM